MRHWCWDYCQDFTSKDRTKIDIFLWWCLTINFCYETSSCHPFHFNVEQIRIRTYHLLHHTFHRTSIFFIKHFFSFFNQLPEREKNAVKETHFFTKRSLTTLNIFNALVDTIVSKILKWTKVFFPFEKLFFLGTGVSKLARRWLL